MFFKLLRGKSLLVILLSFFAITCTDRALNRPNYFPYGVASGDPDYQSVVLWTKLDSISDQKVVVGWQVAKDRGFVDIINEGTLVTEPSSDFTVKVAPNGLQPGTSYYYRFQFQESYSSIGKTRTLPENSDTVRIGVVNCAKYEGGYFNAYDALSKFEGIDAVLHLGDYIYENPAVFPDYYKKSAEETNRVHQPAHELLTLQDYRTRFKQYHLDSSLQKLHHAFPMINIWDDHEFANDTWRDGAGGHNDDEGSWKRRKESAMKAYFENIPIRGDWADPIYRSFQFAELVNLMMLDARICCRTSKTYEKEELINSEEEIIGNEQFEWLSSRVQNSKAIWNVLGNQMMFSIPFPDNPGLDAWAGYPKDRNKMLELLRERKDSNMFIVSGDSHEAYHFITKDSLNREVLYHEFMPGSITSGNYDERAYGNQTEIYSAILRHKQVEDLSWFDLTNHGFMIIEFTPTACQVDWYQVSTKLNKNYKLVKAHSYKLNRK